MHISSRNPYTNEYGSFSYCSHERRNLRRNMSILCNINLGNSNIHEWYKNSSSKLGVSSCYLKQVVVFMYS